MSDIQDGGQAFPMHERDDALRGMTMRDYFAAKALPAVMEEYFRGNGICLGAEHAPRNCAAHAYAYADAMLKARTR